MEVWKIVFHSILEIFHSIPFWHLPYSPPKFPFHSIFHSIPYHALLKSSILGLNFVSDPALVGGRKVHCLLRYFSSKLQSSRIFSLNYYFVTKQPVKGISDGHSDAVHQRTLLATLLFR